MAQKCCSRASVKKTACSCKWHLFISAMCISVPFFLSFVTNITVNQHKKEAKKFLETYGLKCYEL